MPGAPWLDPLGTSLWALKNTQALLAAYIPPSAFASIQLRGYKQGQYIGKNTASFELEERYRLAEKWTATAYAGIAWFAPNTQAIMGYDHSKRLVGENLAAFQMRPWFIYASAAVLAIGILGIQQHSEFIYFRF